VLTALRRAERGPRDAAAAWRMPSPALSFVGKFLVISAALALAAAPLGPGPARTLLPLLRAEITWLGDPFRVEDLSVGREGADQVIRLQVAPAHALRLSGRLLTPDPHGRADATTLLGNITLPAVLLLATALAWPARQPRCYVWRAALLAPALLLTLALIVPLLLLGSLWGLVLQAADPERFSPLLLWCDCLHSGGAAALAAALGICAGRLTQDVRPSR